MSKTAPKTRTVDVRPTVDSLVKPGELIDVVEVTPLTLNDRRVYNLLLENAWDAIDKQVEHVIAKSDLRGTHNSNDRVGESIERLMTAIVRVKTMRDGEPHLERVQLLGGNTETLRRDGLLTYEIPGRLRRIIANSTVFARLRREIMFALSSKYALTLYEMVQKRGNLKYRTTDRFSLDELRAILGVPDGKLTTWSNLNLRALQPAVAEVNQLADFMVAIDPIKTGRKVTHVDMRCARRARSKRRPSAPAPHGWRPRAPRWRQRPTRPRGCGFRATTFTPSKARGVIGARARNRRAIPTAPTLRSLPPLPRITRSSRPVFP